MQEYYAELDGIDGCCEIWYQATCSSSLVDMVEEDLQDLGGGHADIFDEDGNFIMEVEI